MKNRGFSLIELIVVIAIMAVALAVGGYALNAISLANAKNCATEIKTSLEKTRSLACSTDGDETMSLYRSSSGKVVIEKEGTTKEIGGKSVKVEYRVKDGDYQPIGSQANRLTFGFNRSTGGFNEGSTVENLKVTGGGKIYILTCYKLTGKIKME